MLAIVLTGQKGQSEGLVQVVAIERSLQVRGKEQRHQVLVREQLRQFLGHQSLEQVLSNQQAEAGGGSTVSILGIKLFQRLPPGNACPCTICQCRSRSQVCRDTKVPKLGTGGPRILGQVLGNVQVGLVQNKVQLGQVLGNGEQGPWCAALGWQYS